MVPIKMLPERYVLIIDDEEPVRDALRALLSTAEIESSCYRSAEEFLESSQLTEGACILLDNKLAGMSGLELLINVVGEERNSRVIMINGVVDVLITVFEL